MNENIVSTGLEGLDQAIGGLRPGENVVWQIKNIADYMYVANQFLMTVARSGKRIVYFRFAEHDQVMDADAMTAGGANAKMYEIDPHIGFESFTVLVNNIIEQEGEGVFYVFDCLSELQKYWFSDLMVSNFYLLTNPYLNEMNAIGYFPLMYAKHTYETISRIRHAAPVLLNVFTEEGAMYIHAVNVSGRSTPTMYFPVCYRDGRWSTLTSSVDNFDLFRHFVQVGEQRDSWDRMIEDLSAGRYSETEVDNIRQCLLGIEPQRLELCRQYFGVKDLLAIMHREIGTGCIGGKAAGMLLARNVLRDTDPEFFERRIEPHDSFYIGADVFYTYFVDNGCWQLRKQMQDSKQYHRTDDYMSFASRIQERLLSGTFDDRTREQFLSMLEYFGQSPIIVRSSSILEDGFGNAFAGK